jgi:hypothetical protein
MEREQILKKLFDNNEKNFDCDEVVFIAKCIASFDGKITTAGPYDHAKGDIGEACGFSKEDFDRFGEILKKAADEQDDTKKGVSNLIEKIEAGLLSDPKMARMLVYQFLKIMMRNPLGLILSSLLGGKA